MTSAAEVIMNFSTAAVSATPSVPTPFEPTSPPPGVVTEILTKGSHVDDGVFAALIAAIAVSVLLLLVCIGVLLLWSSSRHKGSYATNETEDEEGEEGEEDEEEALQRTRVED